MNCPKCNNLIQEVIVVSKCYQFVDIVNDVYIDDGTYGEPMVEDTMCIQCTHCFEDITNIIKEF